MHIFLIGHWTWWATFQKWSGLSDMTRQLGEALCLPNSAYMLLYFMLVTTEVCSPRTYCFVLLCNSMARFCVPDKPSGAYNPKKAYWVHCIHYMDAICNKPVWIYIMPIVDVCCSRVYSPLCYHIYSNPLCSRSRLLQPLWKFWCFYIYSHLRVVCYVWKRKYFLCCGIGWQTE